MSVYSDNKLNPASPNEAWSKIFGFVKPNSKVLDIGCSSGHLGAALKKAKKVHIMGLDINKEDVELAKESLDDAQAINVETDDLSTLGQFDIIIMADVIEHLLDPVKALKRVKKLLTPGGRLVFSIPNMANATVRVELLKGRFEYKEWGLLDKTHLHFYDQEEVERVFKASGYNVKATDCTIRNVPVEILEKELEPVGVIVTAKLVEFLNSPEALTYQFIGYAEPTKSPRGFKVNTTSPLDSISREIDQLTKSHNQEVSSRDDKIAKLIEQSERLQSELSSILNSRGWKALSRLYALKRKVSRH